MMDKKDKENYILYPLKRFLDSYKKKDGVRLHMPGHKGSFGYENDITEIGGADSLYAANGIISDSEKRTAELFGADRTFFSTEGSSQVIKTMCSLALQRFYKGTTPIIIASRNAHKSFIYASMLLGFDIHWIADDTEGFTLCKCDIKPEGLRHILSEELGEDYVSRIAAVYVTSPDYLGNILDIKGLAQVAHEYKLPLLVDNAHGSYLKFCEKDMHPISLGADMTADSAHKTLPALTGGAYLHISGEMFDGVSDEEIRRSSLMFGSTSPSYMIMQSLDMVPERVKRKDYIETEKHIRTLKSDLAHFGYKIYEDRCPEPLKLVIETSNLKVTGEELAGLLRENNIECEYGDPDFLVTMWSPFNRYPDDFLEFRKVMRTLSPKVIDKKKRSAYENAEKKSVDSNLRFKLPEVKYQPREMLYLPRHREEVSEALVGEVVADIMVSCPPAVSPVVAGEILDKDMIKILKHYHIDSIEVLN